MLPNVWYYIVNGHSHTKKEIVSNKHFTNRLVVSMKLLFHGFQNVNDLSLKDKTFIWNKSIAHKKGEHMASTFQT